MGSIASQITSLTSVYSSVYSGADQRKHQSSASLAFVRGIHRRSVNSPHKGPVTRKMFPFDDVIMKKKDTPCWNNIEIIQNEFILRLEWPSFYALTSETALGWALRNDILHIILNLIWPIEPIDRRGWGWLLTPCRTRSVDVMGWLKNCLHNVREQAIVTWTRKNEGMKSDRKS